MREGIRNITPASYMQTRTNEDGKTPFQSFAVISFSAADEGSAHRLDLTYLKQVRS